MLGNHFSSRAFLRQSYEWTKENLNSNDVSGCWMLCSYTKAQCPSGQVRKLWCYVIAASGHGSFSQVSSITAFHILCHFSFQVSISQIRHFHVVSNPQVPPDRQGNNIHSKPGHNIFTHVGLYVHRIHLKSLEAVDNWHPEIWRDSGI